MPNPIKYSTTNVSNSIRKGNMVLGTNSTFDYGPSETSGFYSGINPPTSGYTIYSVSPPSLPTIVCPANDADLIYWSRILGGTNITTAAGALNYLATQSNIITLNKNYPDIVTSGMVLNLDATFVASYPTSGATWYDITGNANNVTLTNGPTYSNQLISFDGTNDYADFYAPNLGTTVTVEMVCILGAYNGKMFFGWGIYDVWCANNNIGYNTGNSDLYGISSATAGSLGVTTKYLHYIFEIRSDVSYTNNKIYVNGISQSLSQLTGIENANARNFNSGNGRISGWGGGNGYHIAMNLSYFRVYNRALTQTEILQNYYRANIVTNGLVMMLDAANIVSYPTSGTTWYDLSGYGNHGTLINGPSFLSGARPSISLDGVNDKVDTPATLSGFTYNIHYDLNWTIETWMYVRTYDATPQSYKSIYGNYNGCNWNNKGNANGIYIYSTGAQNTIYLTFSYGPRNVAPASQCPDIQASWSNAEIGSTLWGLQNRWSHFVLTSDDGTTLKLFVDGVQVGATKTVAFKNSQNRIDNTLAATSNYSWGGNQIGFNDVNFSICRMYNRALTSIEVLQNYNANKSNFN